MPRERHKVSPIRAIILLLDMTFKPAMRIGRLQEVDLSPFELLRRAICSTLRIRLHATNNTLVGDEVSRPVTLVAGRGTSDCQSRNGKGLEQVLNHPGKCSRVNEGWDMRRTWDQRLKRDASMQKRRRQTRAMIEKCGGNTRRSYTIPCI